MSMNTWKWSLRLHLLKGRHVMRFKLRWLLLFLWLLTRRAEKGRNKLKVAEEENRKLVKYIAEYCSVQRCIYCWRTSLRYANVAQHAHATAGTMSAYSAGHFYPLVLRSHPRLSAPPKHRILSVVSRVITCPRSLWVCEAEARLDVVNGLGQTTIRAEKWQ